MAARILYSADPVGAAIVPAVAAPVSVMHVPTQAVAGTGMQTHAEHELIVVDRRVPDSERLIADLQAQRAQGRSIDILALSGDRDPLTAITERLQASDHPFTAIQILSHGEPGALMLGNLRLDADALLAEAA